MGLSSCTDFGHSKISRFASSTTLHFTSLLHYENVAVMYNTRELQRTLHDSGTDLSPHSVLGPAPLHCDQMAGFHHTGLNGVHIQGPYGAQVNHLGGGDRTGSHACTRLHARVTD